MQALFANHPAGALQHKVIVQQSPLAYIRVLETLADRRLKLVDDPDAIAPPISFFANKKKPRETPNDFQLLGRLYFVVHRLSAHRDVATYKDDCWDVVKTDPDLIAAKKAEFVAVLATRWRGEGQGAAVILL